MERAAIQLLRAETLITRVRRVVGYSLVAWMRLLPAQCPTHVPPSILPGMPVRTRGSNKDDSVVGREKQNDRTPPTTVGEKAG